MNHTIINKGFLPLTAEHIKFDNDAIINGLISAVKALNPNYTSFIIEGCNLTVSGSDVVMSSGSIFYNNEIFQVDAQTYLNKTLQVIQTYSFDLIESFDTYSKQQYLNGNIYETRKIRKATLVSTPSTFTNTIYYTLTRSQALTNASNLASHSAKNNNHNYLNNHINDGMFNNINPTSIQDQAGNNITFSTSGNYISRYYFVGNLCTYQFCITFTIGEIKELIFNMPTEFPEGNGYGDANILSSTNVDYYGKIINNPSIIRLIPHITTQINAKSIRFYNTTGTNLSAGTYTLLGSFTFKKI